MALADTAKLVASLELQDKFSGTAGKFDRTLAGLEQRSSTFGRIGSEVGRGLGAATQNLQRLAVVGVGVIGANVAAGIQTLIRLEEVTAATNAVIKSTGGVAGITAEEVRNLAEKYEGLNATMDDKVIQSGENMLLTFTNITEKAFEPALQAALDMNQAMGGGEEGLQNTIIQVGKALNDPIRGVTALRRVGVQLSRQQEDQIKTLIEQNDLYGAQQIILQELGREFGGQFAAAGDTAAGKFAKFKDAIEDAQAALATAFLPVLEKVADKLTTLLADPATIAAISEFGGNLAEGFDELIKIAGNLPWESIGEAFRVMGTGSKALLDAFIGLPPWVQTAVLTGWGLNKLTGGALTSIAGALTSGLIRGILGINAGVVNINAATVNGVGGGRGGGRAPGLPFLGLLGPLGLGLGIGELTQSTEVAPEVQAQALADALRRGVPFDEVIAQLSPTRAAIEQVLTNTELQTGLSATQIGQLEKLVGGVGSLGITNEQTLAEQHESRRQRIADARQTQQQLDNLRGVEERSESQRRSDALQSFGVLERINAKDTSPTISFTNSTTVVVEGRTLAATYTKQQLLVGKGPQEF